MPAPILFPKTFYLLDGDQTKIEIPDFLEDAVQGLLAFDRAFQLSFAVLQIR